MAKSKLAAARRWVVVGVFMVFVPAAAGCSSAAVTASPSMATTATAASSQPVGAASPTAAPTAAPTPTPVPTPTAKPTYGPPNTFVPTGSMTVGRDSHTATLLADGRVLVVGGEGAGAAASAELYDPATGTFAKTGSPSVGRDVQSATLLADGRVLVAGGMGSGGNELASAELYDPSSGKFTATGSMIQARVFHTATLLADGRVLITGGRGSGSGTNSSGLATAELYNPSTGKFTAVAQMTRGRMFHTATLLSDGRVLLAGGNGDKTAELFDTATQTFHATGSMASVTGSHVAARLADGKVLVAGDGLAGGITYPKADLYDPATGQFHPTGPMLNSCNCSGPVGSPSSALPLPDGRVLVPDARAAGSDMASSAELYDPVAGVFSQAGDMSRYRFGMSMTLLNDGRVLFAGNEGVVRMMASPTLSPAAAAANEADRASAELYIP